MLQVSKTSWHYRLWRLGRESPSKPKNLCLYFWHLFIVKLLIPLVVAGFALFGIGALLWLIIQNPIEAAQVIALVLLVVGAVVGFIYWAYQAEQKKIREKEELELRRMRGEVIEEVEPKQPNLIMQWLRARKQKVCPLIKVVD